MNPSRELDQLIAEKVFGHEVVDEKSSVGGRDKFYKLGEALVVVPPYSTNIAAAWMVLEELRSRGYQFVIDAECIRCGGYSVYPRKQPQGMAPIDFWIKELDAPMEYSDSAPHAICLAALKACQ